VPEEAEAAGEVKAWLPGIPEENEEETDGSANNSMEDKVGRASAWRVQQFALMNRTLYPTRLTRSRRNLEVRRLPRLALRALAQTPPPRSEQQNRAP
jgi:hypothetical protein